MMQHATIDTISDINAIIPTMRVILKCNAINNFFKYDIENNKNITIHYKHLESIQKQSLKN